MKLGISNGRIILTSESMKDKWREFLLWKINTGNMGGSYVHDINNFYLRILMRSTPSEFIQYTQNLENTITTYIRFFFEQVTFNDSESDNRVFKDFAGSLLFLVLLKQKSPNVDALFEIYETKNRKQKKEILLRQFQSINVIRKVVTQTSGINEEWLLKLLSKLSKIVIQNDSFKSLDLVSGFEEWYKLNSKEDLELYLRKPEVLKIFNSFENIQSGHLVCKVGDKRGKVYECVGVRGNHEVLISESNEKRRGNSQRRDPSELFIIASVYPRDEESDIDEVDIPVAKSEFFSKFQIGVEVEGEFIKSTSEIKSATPYFHSSGNITDDHSLYPQNKNGGYLLELITPIIKTKFQEKKFLIALKKIEDSRVGQFSYRNKTAGTHIHVDIKDEAEKELRKKYDIPQDFDLSELMRFFNSVEFERYFFRQYFQFFRKNKFWKRLTNEYCRSFLPLDGRERVKPMRASEIESEKVRRGKYKWLNFKSLEQGTGIEFRIFPYITTSKGMEKILDFSQMVIESYFKNITKEDVHLIMKYSNIYRVTTADEKSERIVRDYFNTYSIPRVQDISFDGMKVLEKCKLNIRYNQKAQKGKNYAEEIEDFLGMHLRSDSNPRLIIPNRMRAASRDMNYSLNRAVSMAYGEEDEVSTSSSREESVEVQPLMVLETSYRAGILGRLSVAQARIILERYHRRISTPLRIHLNNIINGIVT